MVTGFGNLGTLVFAVVFTGGILSTTTRDVWRIVGWVMLDGATASATIAFVGFWMMATSAREARNTQHVMPARPSPLKARPHLRQRATHGVQCQYDKYFRAGFRFLYLHNQLDDF